MNLALFDFDGTITTQETLPSFMCLAVEPHRLAVGKVLLAPLVLGYKLGLMPGTVVRSVIVRFGFSGVPLAKLEAQGLTFAKYVLPQVTRYDAIKRIHWHRERGDTVVVVSGGFDVYLRPWCEAQQVGLICSSLEHRDGIATGRYLGPQCVREEKARRVREAFDLSSYGRIYAYGDTREDLGLLGLAHERYYRWRQVST
jgi:HAD superfamily hydrolase (TIGR01490 family)